MNFWCKVCKLRAEEKLITAGFCYYVKLPSPWRYVGKSSHSFTDDVAFAQRRVTNKHWSVYESSKESRRQV